MQQCWYSGISNAMMIVLMQNQLTFKSEQQNTQNYCFRFFLKFLSIIQLEFQYRHTFVIHMFSRKRYWYSRRPWTILNGIFTWHLVSYSLENRFEFLKIRILAVCLSCDMQRVQKVGKNHELKQTNLSYIWPSIMCWNQTFEVVHALKEKNIGSLFLVRDGLKLQLSKNVLHLFTLRKPLETGPLTIAGLFSNFISTKI